ncbi:hypothetical protein [Pseudoalteromonas sp. HF66]|uniref:hypothetical protein n=1 Tax=Pseudoalteromonas sp. HF66 TaxID=2721559 RepID=UPI00143214D9|nr:hypothetical protein [Pseudoalteromonas sp. HF66]NIZ07194.1 hypothetical protein [Pseudoalteromonas sp. HF66]
MIDAICFKDIVDSVNQNLKSLPIRGVCFDSVDPVTSKAMEEINSKIKKHVLVAILFCNPKTDFCQKEILASLSYLHHRSKHHINIFCCGYGAYWPEHKYPDLEIVTSIGGTEWYYSDNAFVEAIEAFENTTKWKYSGENELLLLDVSPSNESYSLNINSAIVCNLERMKLDKAFSSVRSLLEDIIRYASSTNANDAWEFSDIKGGELAVDFLKNTILSFLPKQLQVSYKKAESYAIKKI